MGPTEDYVSQLCAAVEAEWLQGLGFRGKFVQKPFEDVMRRPPLELGDEEPDTDRAGEYMVLNSELSEQRMELESLAATAQAVAPDSKYCYTQAGDAETQLHFFQVPSGTECPAVTTLCPATALCLTCDSHGHRQVHCTGCGRSPVPGREALPRDRTLPSGTCASVSLWNTIEIHWKCFLRTLRTLLQRKWIPFGYQYIIDSLK